MKVEHFRSLLSDDAARELFLADLHGGKCICPYCKTQTLNRQRFVSGKKLRCATCGKWYTLYTGTVLTGVKMKPAIIAALWVLIAEDVADETIARLLGISTETVRLWKVRKEEAI